MWAKNRLTTTLSSPNFNMKQRLETFDIARAIGIILVVIGHYNPDDAPAWWKAANTCIYSFHMPVFIFVSGFIYAFYFKKGSYMSFMWKKVKRLFIPYLMASLIVVSIKLITQGEAYVEHPVTPTTYLEIFYLPAAGYYLWFVWALFLMFAVVHLFQNRRGHIILFTLSIVVYFLPFELPDAFCLKEFQEKWVYFMGGVMIVDYKMWKMFDYRWFWAASITCFAALYCCLCTLNHTQYLIVAFAGIGMVISASKMLEHLIWVKQRVLLPMAMSSFTIYLYHTTFSGFAKAAFAKMSIPSHLFTAEACIVVICGVLLPMAMHTLIKNSPKLKWAIGI